MCVYVYFYVCACASLQVFVRMHAYMWMFMFEWVCLCEFVECVHACVYNSTWMCVFAYLSVSQTLWVDTVRVYVPLNLQNWYKGFDKSWPKYLGLDISLSIYINSTVALLVSVSALAFLETQLAFLFLVLTLAFSENRLS